MSKVTDECLRRFESVEDAAKEDRKRIYDLEKFQTVTLTIVGVANFIWFFFIYPWIDNVMKGVK